MLKFVICALVSVFALSGCTETINETLLRIDRIIQRGAPYACNQAYSAYGGWVGTGKGSAKDKASINALYAGVYKLCQSPSTITAVQLVTVGNETAEMIKVIRRTK